MNFLAPYMLWGAAAAGIPIALHLFFRSRYRTIPWAAMKFLLTSVEQTSRRLRFQELLLLLVRVMVLVLLALALARPLSSTVRGAGQGEAVDAVLVFDTSYSMAAVEGSRSRLQKAQDAALAIVDQLPPHSTVQIVACSDRSSLLGPRSPGNLDQARALIQDLKATSQATDLSFGIAEASGVLRRAQASNKELYLFSDMQKLGWEQQSAKLVEGFRDIKDQAAITLVRCGTRSIKNAAIVGISAPAGVPRPEERVDFAVLVRNTGKETLKNLEVSLHIDGEEKAGETQVVAKLEPRETRAVTLSAKLGKAGLRTLSARLKQDDLPGDNRYDHVIEVREQTNLLVIDGNLKEKNDEAIFSSSYFLMHALLPVRENELPRYWLQPRLTTPRLASPALLQRQDVCILVNVPMPTEDKSKPGLHAFLDELKRFVRDGHSLLIFCGDQTNAESYNRILGESYGLLPLPLKKVHKFDAKEPQRVDRNTFALPSYLKFKDDDYYKEFGQISVFKAFEVDETKKTFGGEPKAAAPAEDKEPAEPDKPEPVTVALRYANGMPAVISRKVGAGEVMLVTTAAELGFDPEAALPTWSDWPLNRFYGPFVQVTLNHLLHGASQDHNITAGKAFTWITGDKSPRSYDVQRPDGHEVRLGLPHKDQLGRAIVTAADLSQAGIYQMLPRRAGETSSPAGEVEPVDKAEKTSIPFAVIPDLRESDDLESYSDEQIDARLGFAPRHVIAGTVQTQESGTDRLNREWTTLFLVLVLVLTLGESLLAWWCGRAW